MQQPIVMIIMMALKLLQYFSYAESRATVLIVVLKVKVDFFSKDMYSFQRSRSFEDLQLSR